MFPFYRIVMPQLSKAFEVEFPLLMSVILNLTKTDVKKSATLACFILFTAPVYFFKAKEREVSKCETRGGGASEVFAPLPPAYSFALESSPLTILFPHSTIEENTSKQSRPQSPLLFWSATRTRTLPTLRQNDRKSVNQQTSGIGIALHSTQNFGLKFRVFLVANGTLLSCRLRQPFTFQVSRENTR